MSLQAPRSPCQPGDFDIVHPAAQVARAPPQVFLTVAASRVGNVGSLSCLEVIKAKPHTLHVRHVTGLGIVVVVFEVASKELLVSVFLELQRMVLMNVNHGISTLILTTLFPIATTADIACTYDMVWNLDGCLAFWERPLSLPVSLTTTSTQQLEGDPTLLVAVRAAGFEVTAAICQTTITLSQEELYDLGEGVEGGIDDEIDWFGMWGDPEEMKKKKEISAFHPVHAPLSTTSTATSMTCVLVKPVATRCVSTPPTGQFLPMSPPAAQDLATQASAAQDLATQASAAQALRPRLRPPSREASEAQRVRSQSDSQQWTRGSMFKRRTVSYCTPQDVRGKGSLHQILKLRVVTAVDKHKQKGGWVAEVVTSCNASGNLPLQRGDTVLVLARNVSDRWYGKVAHNEEVAGCFSPKVVRVVWSPELR